MLTGLFSPISRIVNATRLKRKIIMMTVKNHFSYSDFLIKWRRHNDCNDVVALCARLGDSGGGGGGGGIGVCGCRVLCNAQPWLLLYTCTSYIKCASWFWELRLIIYNNLQHPTIIMSGVIIFGYNHHPPPPPHLLSHAFSIGTVS